MMQCDTDKAIDLLRRLADEDDNPEYAAIAAKLQSHYGYVDEEGEYHE